MKKGLLHIIHDLGRGGAETMLVTVVKELEEYNNIVVTLYDNNHFNAEEFKCDKYICLNLKSLFQLPLAVFKLRKIIRENKVDIVHSHLFWPTMVSRLAVPKRIPLLTTIHAFIASSGEYKLWYIKWIDKITYHFRKSAIVAVAKGALREYFEFLKLRPWKSYSLYTFVNNKIFDTDSPKTISHDPVFRLITVGRITLQKNHRFLVEAFKYLPKEKFELYIYGINSLGKKFEDDVAQSQTNIFLKGQVNNINEVIQSYDLFVMSSTYEGFSLAVLEAMAMGMPALLSDISSFREQCEDTAVYFDLNDPEAFATKLMKLSENKKELHSLGESAKHRALNNFTLAHHMEGLRNIYGELLAK